MVCVWAASGISSLANLAMHPENCCESILTETVRVKDLISISIFVSFLLIALLFILFIGVRLFFSAIDIETKMWEKKVPK